MAALSRALPLYSQIFVSIAPNSEPFRTLSLRGWWMPHDPSRQADWFRLVRVRSPLLTESLRFLFLGLLRCFSSPGALLTPYVFRCGCHDITRDGFPHSEILGSSLLCSSPRRIAAYASFFGNLSLGIHRAPSVAYFRVHCSVPLTHRILTTMQLSKCSGHNGHRNGQNVHRQGAIIPNRAARVKGLGKIVQN